MRVHVVGLPHTKVTREYDWCAYTAKVRKLPAMLAAFGHEAIVYADESSDVPVVNAADRQRWFGTSDFDGQMDFDQWSASAPCWLSMNAYAATAIADAWKPGDAIGVIAGNCQRPLVDLVAASCATTVPLVLEWGVGYDGILPRSCRAFESNAWRHHVYGLRGIVNGENFDTVIPNSFVLDEYTRADSDGYLLFLGRHVERKGLATVLDLAKRYDVQTAGRGPQLGDVPYHGIVLDDVKAKLIAGARAVLVPTAYVEPFGGIAVEAMISGVPVITTDFGAFPELVEQGVDGFRCTTLQEWCDAVDAVDTLDRDEIARRAAARWSTEAVAPQYDRWLRRCDQLHRAGWSEMRD